MPKLKINDEGEVVLAPTLGERIRGQTTADALVGSDPTSEESYPWTYAEATKRPIGSLFPLDFTEDDYSDWYRRYQLARRIVDAPIDEAFVGGFKVFITTRQKGQQPVRIESKKAQRLWNKYDEEWIRFFKIVRLQGHCEMIIGWSDDRLLWADNPPLEGSTFSWIQPVPKEFEQELKETETLPRRIEYLTVNFGADQLTLHRTRFIHAMRPKIIDEDKQGESALQSIGNLLLVQVHADWSIGQALFRRASGLLGIFPAKRKVSEAEKTAALNSVANHNSKTVVYIPFGWNIKDILKPGGNLAIARTYKVIVEQIAAGSGIPISVLLGAQKSSFGSRNEEDMKNYYRMIGALQKNMMTPVLTKFYRNCQLAGLIEDGQIEIEWNRPETKTPLEQAREDTEIGALQVIQKRLELENEQPSKQPLSSQELVKLVGKKKS
jgi:hypothetical protein